MTYTQENNLNRLFEAQAQLEKMLETELDPATATYAENFPFVRPGKWRSDTPAKAAQKRRIFSIARWAFLEKKLGIAYEEHTQARINLIMKGAILTAFQRASTTPKLQYGITETVKHLGRISSINTSSLEIKIQGLEEILTRHSHSFAETLERIHETSEALLNAEASKIRATLAENTITRNGVIDLIIKQTDAWEAATEKRYKEIIKETSLYAAFIRTQNKFTNPGSLENKETAYARNLLPRRVKEVQHLRKHVECASAFQAKAHALKDVQYDGAPLDNHILDFYQQEELTVWGA